MHNSSSATITEPARETSQTVRTVFPGKKEISSPPLSCKISNDSDTGGFQTPRAFWQTCSSKSRGEVWTLRKINDAERPLMLLLVSLRWLTAGPTKHYWIKTKSWHTTDWGAASSSSLTSRQCLITMLILICNNNRGNWLRYYSLRSVR